LNDPNYKINVDENVNTFDNLYNDLSYQFPTHIKDKKMQKYGNNRKLPIFLSVECATPSAAATMNVVSFE
jgi:hypothetical protein